MAVTTLLEAALRRDRLVVVAGLLAVTLASWLFVLDGAGTGMSTLGMSGLDLALGGGRRMPMEPALWSPGYAALMVLMWWVMMVAMMLPSASPILLLFARMQQRRPAGGPVADADAGGGAGASAGSGAGRTFLFAAGYLAAWGGFSLLATLAQWALQQVGLMSFMMASTTPWLGGSLLLAAGLWQFAPLKQACLRHCRSPLAVLMMGWRDGGLGAFRMGAGHGLFCLGCCWFLMALLFFGGIMNLWWIGGLALFVLLEKTLPAGHWLGYAAGAVLAGWGAWLLAGGPG